MTTLARTPSGGFILKPGAWEFEAQSFCILAGGYERTGGAGYRSRGLTGKMAPTVRAILSGAFAHPEVKQGDIQRVLWSFLTGLTYRELPQAQQSLVRTLLTPQQIQELDAAAIDIPASLPSAALSQLPAPVRDLITARERLRSAAARPSSSYSDLERIAVRSGLPPKTGQEVPAHRWSWHPSGYLIRYYSESYSRTKIQIVMGGPLRLERDAKGRIVRWIGTEGRRIDVAYREDLGPLRHKKYKDLPIYFFERVTYHFAGPGAPPPREFRNKGWVIIPERSKRRSGALQELRFAQAGVTDSDVLPQASQLFAQAPEDDPAGEIYEGLSEDVQDRLVEDVIDLSGSQILDALNEAREREQDYEELVDPEGGLDDVGDAEHLRDGLGTIVTGDTSDRLGFISDTHADLAREVATATETIGDPAADGGSGTPGGGGSGTPGGGGAYTDPGGVHFDPPVHVPSPGSGGQDRGLSGRPAFP